MKKTLDDAPCKDSWFIGFIMDGNNKRYTYYMIRIVHPSVLSEAKEPFGEIIRRFNFEITRHKSKTIQKV